MDRDPVIGEPILGQSGEPSGQAFTGWRKREDDQLQPTQIHVKGPMQRLARVFDFGSAQQPVAGAIGGSMHGPSGFQHVSAEDTQRLDDIRRAQLAADSISVVEHAVAGFQDLLLQSGEIHDESLLIEVDRLDHQFEFPGVAVDRQAGPIVPLDIVGEVDVD